MRRIALTAIGGLLALTSASCSDKNSRLLADVGWQLTCVGTPGGNPVCNPSMFPGNVPAVYDYRAYDGDPVTDRLSGSPIGVLTAECHAVDIGSGNVQLTLHAQTGNGSLEISGLNVSKSTGAYLGGACIATLYDGVSTYGGSSSLGACSDQVPSAAAPCQITNVVVNPNHADGPSVDLELFCTSLPNDSVPTVKTSVRDSQSDTSPAFLHWGGCTGI